MNCISYAHCLPGIPSSSPFLQGWQLGSEPSWPLHRGFSHGPASVFTRHVFTPYCTATLKTEALIFRQLLFSWPGKMGSRSQLFFFFPLLWSKVSNLLFLQTNAPGSHCKEQQKKEFLKYVGLSCPVDTNAFRKLKVAPRTATSGLAFRYLVAE